jgi:hypothetical protein
MTKGKKGDPNLDNRILKTKREFELLVKEYSMNKHKKGAKSKQQNFLEDKRVKRDLKQQKIKERKFEQELVNQQKSLEFKRNAQQVRLGKQVYKLATRLEKEKLLEEQKLMRETKV